VRKSNELGKTNSCENTIESSCGVETAPKSVE